MILTCFKKIIGIMKPADLIPPFPKDNRKVTIHDGIWYLPDRHLAQNHFEFPGWSHPSLFGNDQPVNVEYCSGNGAWIVAQAEAHPHLNWVAIERKFTRVRKIWSKIKNGSLKNLIVVCGEGLMATRTYFPSASIANVFINFPDPWPKLRHAKHRLIQPHFVQELARVMQTDKALTFVTDDISYSQEAIEVFLSAADFKSYYSHPYFSTEEEGYGTSYFEELWRSKGKMIRYHRFIKK
ncbi:tRNA (guanine(46)-N(7))-methyltransferase TrmB [Neochlamydia sp. AcF65]|uniref:tRNA (guanine(46)-N(7))-methyltransferase TrmB n=1 Tax=Neochlamydia sp. AcF65 TaxID=2795735 RepID=UPI0020161F3C|nr:tRNA (guanine(46)-N(7))-methyltransferase TrmB [Neochlamydia sp. AcF65]